MCDTIRDRWSRMSRRFPSLQKGAAVGDKTFAIAYQEPSSLEEALLRKNALGAEVERIQQQLSCRDRVENGRRLSTEEYWRWHQQANYARMCKVEEIRRLKEWMLRRQAEKSGLVAVSTRTQALARQLLMLRCLRALLLKASLSEREALANLCSAFLEEAEALE